jgi:hypothetical protein
MADTVTFDQPANFVPPENLDQNDEFQAMATFRVLPNKKLELVEIEGYELGETEAEEEEEQEPGAGEAAPTTGATPNQSSDQLAPGALGQRTAGYAERLGQMFRTATRRR